MPRVMACLVAGDLLSACASMPEFAGPPPARKLVLEQALTGRTLGEGAFTNSITGDETAFSVVIEGKWDGKVLTLIEDFTYRDGTQERKTWRLTKTGDGAYQGIREDVVGEAAVRQDGAGVRLDYIVTLQTGLGELDVRFRDLLYLDADGSIANQAVVSKLGLRIGRVTITMHPQSK